jgi:hypothetical protein
MQLKMLSYQEWLKSKEGYETSVTILASNASMYPNRFHIDRQLRLAYEDYKKRNTNESTAKY